MSRLRRSQLLVIGSAVVFGVLIAEAATRVLLFATHQDVAAFDADFRWYRSDPFLGFVLTPGMQLNHPSLKFRTNALGFRGAEINAKKAPGTVRIFCLGGSSTWGFMLNDGQTWPDALQRQLRLQYPGRRIEVVNAGVPGYCTFQSMINLQTRILDYQPDLVIVYHVWNDLKYWAEVTPSRNFAQTFLARDMSPPTFWDRLLHHSRLYILVGLVRRKVTTRFPGGEPVPLISRPDPDLSYGEQVYRRNLINIVATAKANGVRVILSNEATLVKSTSSPDEDRRIMWFLPKPKLIRAFDDADAILRDVAAAEGVRFVDVRGAVPSNLETEMDQTHPTAKGCALIGEVLAHAIRDLI